jgi:general secretion pathway protein G
MVSKTKNRRDGRRGFTILELMVVISIILILISVAAPIYSQTVLRAKEAVLRDDLFQLRSLISQYTQDKQAAPQSLDDLVSSGYIKVLPKDPFTLSSTTWVTTQDEDVLDSPQQTQAGINDVHSGASGVGTDGVAYADW